MTTRDNASQRLREQPNTTWHWTRVTKSKNGGKSVTMRDKAWSNVKYIDSIWTTLTTRYTRDREAKRNKAWPSISKQPTTT
jgi:hypothetical protein